MMDLQQKSWEDKKEVSFMDEITLGKEKLINPKPKQMSITDF
jgi:hypothetical protein